MFSGRFCIVALLPSFQFCHRIPNIGLRNDCVALEHAPRFPAADLHNHAFGDSGSAKIPSGAPSQIVEEQVRHLGRFTRIRPRSPKVPDWRAALACEHKIVCAFAMDALREKHSHRKGRKVMYFVATNHIEYFDRAVTRSERFDAIMFMSPPSFAAKTKKLLDILKDTYRVEPTLAHDVTQEAVEKAMPTLRCEQLEKEIDRHIKERIGAERIREECLLAKFALLRWDELHDLALHLEASMGGEKIVSKMALAEALAQIKDGGSRRLVDCCRFRSDPQNYERFDASRNARWIVSELEGFTGSAAELPQPVKEEDGVRVVDAPVGPVGNVKVSGYIAERAGSGSAPGHIRLRKAPST